MRVLGRSTCLHTAPQHVWLTAQSIQVLWAWLTPSFSLSPLLLPFYRFAGDFGGFFPLLVKKRSKCTKLNFDRRVVYVWTLCCTKIVRNFNQKSVRILRCTKAVWNFSWKSMHTLRSMKTAKFHICVYFKMYINFTNFQRESNISVYFRLFFAMNLKVRVIRYFKSRYYVSG